ncbi:MAG: rRNA maturation RNase YbeY [Firmicutes bacterium]|nr:rRNA maturation RNase YbeY [Bacillota bacterium]
MISREKRGLGLPNAAVLIKRAASAALEAEGVDAPCEISVLLTDGDGIRALNREFRGVDAPTDVLSFPQNDLTPGHFDVNACERDPETSALLLGDMALNIPRCIAQGREYGHGAEREARYLTVHSVLHLLGYDHMDEGGEKRRMRAREKEIMRKIEENK